MDNEKGYTGGNREKPVLSVCEAAQIARVGRNTMYALVHSGALPSVRIGRQIRISRAELYRYLGISLESA